MTETREELVAHRLGRARETLADARLLADQKRWSSCVNRLYYACFYAVSALLLHRGLTSTKHTGIRSLFNRHFVKTGEISKELGKIYNDLFELRQESDYVDLVHFDKGQVLPWVEPAELFLERIEDLATADTPPEVATADDSNEKGTEEDSLIVSAETAKATEMKARGSSKG